MNRLILIGNGFDLAHGIKSNVSDFVLNYMLNAVNTFIAKNYYEDDLLKIRAHYQPFYGINVTIERLDGYIETFKKDDNTNFEFKSVLLENIYENHIRYNKWVDVEILYFNLLVNLINSNDEDIIKEYNQQFEYFKTKFLEYLKLQEKTFNKPFFAPLSNSFEEDIKKDDIVFVNIEKDQTPENLYILNFNYTDTLVGYSEECRIPNKINHIHGRLNDTVEPPIFGFGDELNKDYKNFEEKNDNQLFEHIKSFKYSLNSNYHDLMRFIESNLFQVHIYGHSCGLSDRTMLNQIFESKNCVSIKIFYYEKEDGSNDFTEKLYDIYRHINDKALLRKKIVSFTNSEPMPQPR